MAHFQLLTTHYSLLTPPMPHEPIQFGPRRDTPNEAEVSIDPSASGVTPRAIDVDRDRALTIDWSDGTRSVLPVALLRRLSPSAEAKAWRDEQAKNPLAVLPTSKSSPTGPLRIENAELVGNYALRLSFSDGHSSGLYAWDYLRALALRGDAE